MFIRCSSPSLSCIAAWRAFIARCRSEICPLRGSIASTSSSSFSSLGSSLQQCGHSGEILSHSLWQLWCANFLQHGKRRTLPAIILKPWCSSIKQNIQCWSRTVSGTISASRPRSLRDWRYYCSMFLQWNLLKDFSLDLCTASLRDAFFKLTGFFSKGGFFKGAVFQRLPPNGSRHHNTLILLVRQGG